MYIIFIDYNESTSLVSLLGSNPRCFCEKVLFLRQLGEPLREADTTGETCDKSETERKYVNKSGHVCTILCIVLFVDFISHPRLHQLLSQSTHLHYLQSRVQESFPKSSWTWPLMDEIAYNVLMFLLYDNI